MASEGASSIDPEDTGAFGLKASRCSLPWSRKQACRLRAAWCVAGWIAIEVDEGAVECAKPAGYNNQTQEPADKAKPLTNPFTLTPDNPEPLEHLPFIVVVIDELADLMMVVEQEG